MKNIFYFSQEAERAIATGAADFAAVGSAMMEEAEWTRHAREAIESKK